MKTTIIQIEAHDDLISVKDKMAWYSCQRMILVWPKKGRLVTGFLDLVLIKRTAQSLGSEIALVTHNSEIKENAESLNIPVFQSIPMAEKSDWMKKGGMEPEKKFLKGSQAIDEMRTSFPRNDQKQDLPKLVKIVTMSICILALVGLFLFLLPKASITLYPQKSIQEIEIDVTVSSEYSGITPSGGLPGMIESVELSGELSHKSSGEITIPTTKAQGEVVFTNLTQGDVFIPSQTILGLVESGQASYVTLESVIVQGGKSSQASVRVEAIEAGSDGNIAEQRISTILGDVGELVTVSNESPISGGAGINVPAPVESDYETLERQLLTDLKKQAVTLLNSSLKEGSKLIPESVVIDKVILEDKVNPIDQASDLALLRITVRFRGLSYSLEDETALADLILDSNLPVGFRPIDQKTDIKDVSGIAIDNAGNPFWKISAQRFLVPSWDKDKVNSLLVGKNKEDAARIIDGVYPQQNPAKIQLMTRWWPWMPFLETRINFLEEVP